MTTTKQVIAQYPNGDHLVTLYQDGSRTVEGEGTFDWPLNIDIRVSEQCSFGFNPATGKAVCDFCHESARTDGKVADVGFSTLLNKLDGLPAGVELAIGANQLTPQLKAFLSDAKSMGWVANLTVNQGHLKRDSEALWELIQGGLVCGLGVSYRPEFDGPNSLLDYSNTVMHVIVGVNSVDSVLQLRGRVRKILVLGEKDFGFNLGRVVKQRHTEWLRRVHELFDRFEVVSFDNLALEQLRISRFFRAETFEAFYQGEHSMYVNAVSGYYSESSRSASITGWDAVTLQDFFKGKER